MMRDREISDVVRRKYGEIAERVDAGAEASCCGPSACGCGCESADAMTDDLYDDDQVRTLPAQAVTAALGCGNPTAWAGCVAGALEESDYRARLAAAGFVDVEVEPTRLYGSADVNGAFMSAFTRGTRGPVATVPALR